MASATLRHLEQVEVPESDVVFVGYGVVAPEYGWDDFKGVDVRGKTVVMLVNDPPVPDPTDPAKLDPTMFRGAGDDLLRALDLQVRDRLGEGGGRRDPRPRDGAGGLSLSVVVGSWGRENFDIAARRTRTRAGSPSRAGSSWSARQGALRAPAGQDFDALQAGSRPRKDFRPVPLGATAQFTVKNALRQVESRNVVAKLEGSDPTLKDEYVIYTAHWDHLGRDTTLPGRPDLQRRADNASGGTAGCSRSRGRSRSRARAEAIDPLPGGDRRGEGPARRQVLRRRIRSIRWRRRWPTSTWTASTTGGGRATSSASASASRRSTTCSRDPRRRRAGRFAPDAEPEKGFFYRSDHFEFAKQGVPALYTDGGIELHRQAGGLRQEEARRVHRANDYHKVTDEVKPDWDLSGAVEDLQLLFEVGLRVARRDDVAGVEAGDGVQGYAGCVSKRR